MIRAKYHVAGDEHRLTLKGHAGYSTNGNDIVCSAVSSLVYALLGWLENNSEDVEWSNTFVESGDVSITCYGGARTTVAFDMAAIGLEQIAMTYPDCMEIETVGLAD